MVVTKNAKIWGRVGGGESVPIQFLGKDYTAVADENGRFEAVLKSDNFGGPHRLVIGTHVIEDVYIGRVWLMGGQSNMEWPISYSRTLLGDKILPDARIRAFHGAKGFKFDAPAEDVQGSWEAAFPTVPDHFYAVPYFFAQALLEHEDTPVGLVCAPVGGTPIERWLPQEIIENYPARMGRLRIVQQEGHVERETAAAAEKIAQWNAELAEKEAGENWQHESYDDSAWQQRVLHDHTNAPHHGSIWLRRKMNLKSVPIQYARVEFGRMEFAAQIYINGYSPPMDNWHAPPDSFTVPQNVLKQGENTIAVRIVGAQKKIATIRGNDYSLTIDGTKIDLAEGTWRARTGAEMPACPADVWFYHNPCGVYNHNMAPLLGYSIDGIAWYQGESDVGEPENYADLFRIWAKFMRVHFGENTPIVWVQLANFIDPNAIDNIGYAGENWAQLREAQRQCLDIPNSGMAVAIDCGEPHDIHPADKRTVGRRLALHAMKLAYKRDIQADGPTPISATHNDEIVSIQFANAAGLWAKGGHPLLEIVTSTGICRKHATIRGDTLQCKASPSLQMQAVRYGYADFPSTTLYNAHGLPAAPFQITIREEEK
jgi:sialate O-acetylesterase